MGRKSVEILNIISFVLNIVLTELWKNKNWKKDILQGNTYERIASEAESVKNAACTDSGEFSN